MASSNSNPSAPNSPSGGRPFTRRHYAPRKSTKPPVDVEASVGGGGEGKTSDIAAHRLIERELSRLAAARAAQEGGGGGGRSKDNEPHPYRRSSKPQGSLKETTITNLEGEETTYWRFIPPPPTRDQRLMGVFKQEAKRNKIGVIPRRRPTAAGTSYPGALNNYPLPQASPSSSSSLPSLPSIPSPN